MSKIQILDPKTALKIAAGEVIERPASAVRELVDNSLDAGASWISVRLEKGGKEFLSVQDNGTGMDEENIQKSWLNHATSKIRNFEDLDKLMSFGFRGEALASIAEIAELNISSCIVNSSHGHELIVRFGEEISLLPKGMNQGTTISVTNFFENVPARLKFLGSDTSEYRSIVQEILKKALARPDVAFELFHNNEKKYNLPVASELLNRIEMVFPDCEGMLRPFIYEEHGIKAYGFLSDPSWYKSSRAYQYLFVNGRAIEWKAFTQQISVAYNNLIPPAKFPAVFCYLEMNTEQIDFNVHPQKKEIRFENEKTASDTVRRALRLGLEYSTVASNVHENREPLLSSKISLGKQELEEKVVLNNENNRPYNSDFVKNYSLGSRSITRPSFFQKPNFRSASANVQMNQISQLFEQKKEVEKPYQILKKANYKGVIFHTYLLWEYQEILYVVDFHALHERIRYEKLLDLHQTKMSSQQIVPIVFVLSREEADLFESLEENFEQLGFDISRLDQVQFQISSIPSILSVSQAEIVVRELFTMNMGSLQDSYLWDSICKMIACKGSVRSGDKISEPEALELLDLWSTCHYPESCPHGRPIMVKLDHYFFDKQFKRTGF